MAISNNTTNPDNKRRFALIVASSQYSDPDLRKLIAPAQDAISKHLTKSRHWSL